jgi:Autophagy-related protein 101
MRLLPCFLAFEFFSIRSPGPVKPYDVECEGFNLMYPKIANEKLSSLPGAAAVLENDVDLKVDTAITNFLSSLSQIGPELLSVREPYRNVDSLNIGNHLNPSFFSLQGGLTLSFFERRTTRQLFGLVNNEEKVVYVKLVNSFCLFG